MQPHMRDDAERLQNFSKYKVINDFKKENIFDKIKLSKIKILFKKERKM